MNIAVIGANGKAGKLIAYEAYKRGHHVTAILRDSDKMPGSLYPVLEKDLFDLTTDDLFRFDAVVSAYGLPFGGDHPADSYQKATAHLIGLLDNQPQTRLLVVGGAASLYQDESRTTRVMDTIPEAFRKDPADMFEAYKLLQKSHVSYTFFSPACTFDPRGHKTKHYRLGQDVVIRNDAGDSYISYADYACAMVDEIERGDYVRGRFTAVGEKRPDAPAKPYLGIREERPVYEGLSHYREAFNEELTGHTYQLVLDNGTKNVIEFLDGHTLRWSELGHSGTVEHYECAKGGDEVYFVNFELIAMKPRTNLTLVLDTGESLVTLVRTVCGYNSKFPYMVDSQYFFGAIDVPGCSMPTRRHKFTTDLLGKRICWQYGPDKSIVHVYYATDYIRVTMPEGKGWERYGQEECNEMLEREPYDEPAAYIKIKQGLYLVSCLEKNIACRGGTGCSLLFLIDSVRVHDVGRSFGNVGLNEGHVHPENYLFGAFGEFVPSDGILESQPNRVREKQVQ